MLNMLNILNYYYMKMEKQTEYEYKDGRPYWCLDYYKNTMLLLNENGEPIISEPDSVYIIPPHTPTMHNSANQKSWVHTTVTFYADNEYMNSLSIPYMTPIHVPNVRELEQLMFDMHSHKLLQSDLSLSAQNAYLALILIYMHDLLYVRSKDYKVNIGDDLQVIRNTVMNSTHMDWTVDSMAALANMSTRHFTRKYKEIYGKSPISDLYDFRFLRAKRLIENGFSINHILKSCGFKSAQHFSAFFKRRAGITPSEYRKQRTHEG